MSGAAAPGGLVVEASRARILAMQALFARDVGQGRPRDVLDYLCVDANDEALPPETRARATRLVDGVLAHLGELDRQIAYYARQWTLPRLAAVDRNVLRVALFEVAYDGDVPEAVAINEAVEAAKEYGGEDSGRFVNGVLGQVSRDRAAGVLPQF